MEAEVQLECHMVATATALGKGHPVILNQLDALTEYKAIKLALQTAMTDEHGP